MWCGNCQADVAAEVSPDNQRVFCTVCGGLLSTVEMPPLKPALDRAASDRMQDARNLLQRWSSNKVADPISTNSAKPSLHAQPELSVRTGDSVSLATLIPAKTEVEKPKSFSANRSAFAQTAVQLDSEPSVSKSLEPQVDSIFNALESSLPTMPVTANLLAETLTPTSSAPNTTPTPIPNQFDSPLNVRQEPLARDHQWPQLANALNVAATQLAPPPILNPLDNPLRAEAGPNPTTAVTPNPLTQSAASTSVGNITTRIDRPHSMEHFVGRATTALQTSPPMPTLTNGPFSGGTAMSEPVQPTKRHSNWIPNWDPSVWRNEATKISSNWSSTAGQLLAYLGVLGLTIGGCLIVWSFFGGPAQHAQTGWLLATAGQMMLFFGVVTLVSGGLEQTTEQVNRRIELLGDHIIRIEQAARENSLRGHVPPAHFGAAEDLAMSASSDERAVVED